MRDWTYRNFARALLRRWLQAGGSLSARLAATGEVFSVQVLSQGREPLTPEEAKVLGLERGRAGYAREVLLRVDGHAVVFARSVTPYSDSLAAWRSMRGLGTRPLADVLFKRSGIARGPLSYCKLSPATALHRRVRQHLHESASSMTLEPLPRSLSARRSVFERSGAPLLVMEVFIAPSLIWRAPDQVRLHAHERLNP